jgi:hypothetical protein
MQDSSEEMLRLSAGKWTQDDQFYLMTDALACWFLKQFEKGNQPWEILRDLDTESVPMAFSDWVYQLRAEHQLRNDDVTL